MIAFDARSAKAQAAGNHLTFDSAPGLRLKATASTSTWLYRYKSPVDDRMRQVRLVLRGKLPSRGKTIQGQSVGPAKRVLGEAEVSALLHFSSVRNASSSCRSLPQGVRVEPAAAAGTRVGQPARLRAPL